MTDAVHNHSAASAPINIWLVDDNKNLRRTMMELLNACDGIQCRAAFSSPNAVLSTLASKPGPDVILLDIQMGEACGLDAIRPIKALSRSTQVLMFTSRTDNESKRRAFSSGAAGFLLKQFPLERILDGIHQAKLNPAPHLKRVPGVIPAAVPVNRPPPAAAAPANDGRNPHGGVLGRLGSCLSFIHHRRN